MTLTEARAQFEALFAGVVLGPRAHAIDRHPYVTITCGGVKLEGEPSSYPGSSGPEKAIGEWLRHAKAYAKSQGGKFLYWRTVPEIAGDCAGITRVYSRLYVSDATAQRPIPCEYRAA